MLYSVCNNFTCPASVYFAQSGPFVRVCSDFYGHLACTSQVSHGPHRSACIVPGDPLWCSYYCTCSVYNSGKHCEHNFWRPCLLDATPFSVALILPTYLSKRGGGSSGFKLPVTLL